MKNQIFNFERDSDSNELKSFNSSKYFDDLYLEDKNTIKNQGLQQPLSKYQLQYQSNKNINFKKSNLIPNILNLVSFLNNINNSINILSIESLSSISSNNIKSIGFNDKIGNISDDKINYIMYSSLNDLKKDKMNNLNDIDDFNKQSQKNIFNDIYNNYKINLSNKNNYINDNFVSSKKINYQISNKNIYNSKKDKSNGENIRKYLYGQSEDTSTKKDLPNYSNKSNVFNQTNNSKTNINNNNQEYNYIKINNSNNNNDNIINDDNNNDNSNNDNNNNYNNNNDNSNNDNSNNDNGYKINKNNFENTKILLGKKDNKTYVMKKNIQNENVESIKREAKFLKKFNNKHIVKYKDSFDYNKTFFIIVMEYCGNNNLRKYIDSFGNSLINPCIIYKILKDICLGLKDIHEKNIVHKDLKPENIFIGDDFNIKIGDFGISKQLDNDNKVLNSKCSGTSNYMAPELLIEEGKYNCSADIWSLGCIIYELCEKKKCFENFNIEIYNSLKHSSNEVSYEKIKNNKYKIFQDLIDKMLVKDYEKRDNISEICNSVNRIKSELEKTNNIETLDNISKKIFEKINENEIILDINIKKNENFDFSKSIHLDVNNKNIINNIYIDGVKKDKNFTFENEGKHKILLELNNQITNCNKLFKDFKNLLNADLSFFDITNVENLESMFEKCEGIKNFDLSSLNFVKVNNMKKMFRLCSNLEQLNLPYFKSSNIIDMEGLCDHCINLKKIDLSFNGKIKVKKLSNMLSYCNKLTEVNLSSFDTSDVEDMNSMFLGCNSLKSLDLSNFNFQNIINLESMFEKCGELENLDLSSFNCEKNKTITTKNMFEECKKLQFNKIKFKPENNYTQIERAFNSSKKM